MKHRLWTREELILALNLYLQLPFGKMHRGTTEVKHLAKVIRRTPDAVAMRLVNYASLDPYHKNRGVKGLPGGERQCRPIWEEFINSNGALAFEAEQLMLKWDKTPVEKRRPEILKDLSDRKTATRREVTVRINQDVFRDLVLNAYNFTCAVTGIDIPRLLSAGHIIPWAKNEQERLNPENGITLSPLFDKAFDTGLITIDTSYKLRFSAEIKKTEKSVFYKSQFARFENKKITLPKRFIPRKDFLEYHNDKIFRK